VSRVLREGWEVRKLGEIIDIKNGKNQQLVLSETGKYKIMGSAGNVMGYATDYICEAGTTIIGRKGNISKPIYINEKFWNVDTAFGLYPKNENDMDKRFVYYLCLGIDFKSMNRGTTIPSLVKSELQTIQISFPKSLKEQQKIVAILDEAFGAIEKAKANAKLGLTHAKELFESYLQSVFENKGEGWEEKTLGEITTKIGSGATPRGGNSSYKLEGISLIRSMNVHDFTFRDKNLAFIDEAQANALSNVTLQEDDVLLNITGASIARCCLVPKEYLPARVNQHVSIIRAKKEIINPLFLSFLLTSKFYKDKILKTGEQGATRQAITKAQLENFIIIFPKTLKEQMEILNNSNTLSEQTKALEKIYQQKINDLDELKKSILQKAFNGDLL
jgi:type I restriction enzyme S subunit